MNEVETKARELFAEGYLCAESVLMAVAGSAPAMASGFCGGVSRTCGMCGAVSGGIMALGAAKGRTDNEQSVEEVYAAVQRLIDGFQKEFKTTNCAELLGLDLATEEGQAAFKERELAEKCQEYTGTAARLTAAILEDGMGVNS